MNNESIIDSIDLRSLTVFWINVYTRNREAVTALANPIIYPRFDITQKEFWGRQMFQAIRRIVQAAKLSAENVVEAEVYVWTNVSLETVSVAEHVLQSTPMSEAFDKLDQCFGIGTRAVHYLVPQADIRALFREGANRSVN